MLEAIQLPSLSAVRARLPFTPRQRRFLARALILAFSVRIGLLIVAYITGYMIIGREGVQANEVFLETMKRWDAFNFERLVEHGYESEGEQRLYLVYLPLFPMTVKALTFVIPSFFVSALLVSAVASVAAGVFLQLLVHGDGGDEAESGRALWYFYLFPTAHFLALPYTEGLFMAALLGSFLAARRGRWGWAGILAALATGTRIQGIALPPALALEAWHQQRWDPLRTIRRSYWLLLAPAGFLAYLVLNWVVAGDPFQFVDIQREHWQQHAVWPWQTVRDTFDWITDGPPGGTRLSIYEMRGAFLLLAGFLLALGAGWLRPSYQLFAWASIVFFLSSSFQISIPRYVLILFPLYLVMARIGRHPELHQAMLTISALLMAMLFVMYATRFGF